MNSKDLRDVWGGRMVLVAFLRKGLGNICCTTTWAGLGLRPGPNNVAPGPGRCLECLFQLAVWLVNGYMRKIPNGLQGPLQEVHPDWP